MKGMGPFYKHKQKLTAILLVATLMLVGVRFVSFDNSNFKPVDHHHHHHHEHKKGDMSLQNELLMELQGQKNEPAGRAKIPDNVKENPILMNQLKQQQQQQKQRLIPMPGNNNPNSQVAVKPSQNSNNNNKPKTSPVSPYSGVLKDLERIVHIDLKGAPPKLEYLKQFIPFVKKHGATGILLEYEDTFPFTGKLAEAKHGHAYTLKEVKMMKDLIKENGLTLMPLVQTYGHLEWLLKVKSFAHLREDSRFPQVITPCLEESYTVLYGNFCFRATDIYSHIMLF
jgi:hypothetical protein